MDIITGGKVGYSSSFSFSISLILLCCRLHHGMNRERHGEVYSANWHLPMKNVELRLLDTYSVVMLIFSGEREWENC